MEKIRKSKFSDPKERQKLLEKLKEEDFAKQNVNINVEVDVDDVVQDLWNSMML